MGYGLNRRSEVGLKCMTPRSSEAIRRVLGLDGIIFRPPSQPATAVAGDVVAGEEEEEAPSPVQKPQRRPGKKSPRTLTPRQAAAARDTESRRARINAATQFGIHVDQVAATVSGAASQHLPLSQVDQTSRHESKDLLDLKQRTEKAFAQRRRLQQSHSWNMNMVGSGREYVSPAPFYVPPLTLPLGMHERRQRPPSFRHQLSHRQAPSTSDETSLSFRLMATRQAGKSRSAELEQMHTPRLSFRQMEAEARMRAFGLNEHRMPRVPERPFAAPLLREHAPSFWTRGLGPPSTWPAWQKPKVSRFGWRPGGSQALAPPAYV